MFRNAVISVIVALVLACVSDALPEKFVPLTTITAYVALGFAIVSALLSLFEEVEEPAASELHESDDALRNEY